MTKDHGLDGLVVKHNNALQHLISFTIEERRLFDFCVQYYDSRPGASNPRELHLPVSEFKKAYPQFEKYYSEQFFTLLVETASGIQGKPYKPHGKRAIYWFTELELVDDDTDSPIFKISLTKGIMPFFLGLHEHYISYHRSEAIPFNKPTSYTVFEYIQEEFQNGQKPGWRVDLLVLKDRLGVQGKHKRVTDFEKICLKRPIDEINEHTRLKVQYTKLKKGRSITGIKFEVSKKSIDPDTTDTESLNVQFERELLRLGVAAAVAKKYTALACEHSNLKHWIELLPGLQRSYAKAVKEGRDRGSLAAYVVGTLKRLEHPTFEGFDPEPSDLSAYEPDEIQAMANEPKHPLHTDAKKWLKKPIEKQMGFF